MSSRQVTATSISGNGVHRLIKNSVGLMVVVNHMKITINVFMVKKKAE